MKLSSSTRYLRLARIIVTLPTYARLVWGIMRDPRTPIGLKGMLAAALTYVVVPVDLIPDAIPILGHADDLTVLLLVLDLFLQNAPAEVRAEHAARARNGTADLDRDLARLRLLLGDRYDRIRDNLPQLLDRYGRMARSRRDEARPGHMANATGAGHDTEGARMKVILKRDVKGLGHEGDLKEVKDGYARNHLLPTGAAVLADKGALANWERHKDQREERDRSARAGAEATAEKLRELHLEIPVKAGERGRLFGAVTSHQIADAIAKNGIELDRHALHLREPIKALGDYRIDVRVMQGVEATVAVSVVPAES